ncbi:MAG: Na+/H+ antiporter subunit D [Deltaproteobacteria bacterium]|nr:MAG: Na+/H+ antiporter subunit D [Deltaproteobacteria bacterium]
MKNLLISPILIPLITAGLSLVAWKSSRVQRIFGLLGAGALMVAAVVLFMSVYTNGIQVLQVGNWPSPFGITLVADLLSSVMVVLTALVGLAVAVYSIAAVDEQQISFGYFPFFQVLLTGVCGAFLTGDLFNLYVWFEVMLMASFVLMVLGGEPPQVEGGIKYVTLNLLSSITFLVAVGILYAVAHTLNMADLSLKLTKIAQTHPTLILTVAAFFIIGFGIKAGIFPLYFWLPASYHTPPAATSALFAGLLTKVGVYALIRVFTLVFPRMPHSFSLLLTLAGLTMVIGVLGAFAQFEMRRILSFHIISQIGYMIMGLGLLASNNPAARVLGIAAAVFYIAHHIIVKTNLFLISGTVKVLRGTYQLKSLGGLAASSPWLAILFLIPALSLAGIPPLSGFWAKFAMIKAGLQAEQYLVVTAALVAGLLTLMSMIKIWDEAFWKPAPEVLPKEGSPSSGPLTPRRLFLLLGPIILLAGLTVVIGLQPQPLFTVAERAAAQLLDSGEYIQAVLSNSQAAIQEFDAVRGVPL